jgi:hypothetical protein
MTDGGIPRGLSITVNVIRSKMESWDIAYSEVLCVLRVLRASASKKKKT